MFDPYHVWLGIPPKEQPPSYYRLLGIVEFEQDGNVIANAADRCQGFLRGVRTGPRGAVAQVLIDDVSSARKILLDPDTKAEYDHALSISKRGLRPMQPTVAEVAPPERIAPEEPPPFPVAELPVRINLFQRPPPRPVAKASAARKARPVRRDPMLETAKIIVGAVAGIALGAAALWYGFGIDASQRFGLSDRESSQPVAAPNQALPTTPGLKKPIAKPKAAPEKR